MSAPSLTPPAHRAGTRGSRIPVVRLLLLAMGGVSLLTGLNAGLVRLGVWAPVASERVGDLHGPVMVLGFLTSCGGHEAHSRSGDTAPTRPSLVRLVPAPPASATPQPEEEE